MPGSPNPPIRTPVAGDSLSQADLLDALRAVAEVAFADRRPAVRQFYGAAPPKVPGAFPVFWLECPRTEISNNGWVAAGTGQTLQQKRKSLVLARLACGTTQDGFSSLVGHGLPFLDDYIRGLAQNNRLAFTLTPTDPGPVIGGVLELQVTEATAGPIPFAGHTLWGLTWTLIVTGLYTLQGAQ